MDKLKLLSGLAVLIFNCSEKEDLNFSPQEMTQKYKPNENTRKANN